MNEPFSSDPLGQSNQVSPNNQSAQPTGWAPQPVSIPVNVQPSTPFETSSIPNITGPASAPVDQGSGQVAMEPASPKSNVVLYIVLAVLVVAGLIFLAAWMGRIDFGKILGTKKPTATSTAPVVTPAKPAVNQNDATRKTDLGNLKTALEKYYSVNQTYPVSATLTKTSDANSPLTVLVPTYISSLPLDPLSPNSFYGYKSDGKSYQISAILENKSDFSGQMVGTNFLYIVSNGSAETPVTSNPVAPTTPVITSGTTTTTTTTTTPATTDTTNASSDNSSTLDGGSSNSSSSTSTDGSSSADGTSGADSSSTSTTSL
jgi:hypothetical protein